jgi:hypothetical protein
MMIERVIYDILTAGVEWFQEDSRRVEEFYLKQGLSATESAKIRAYFDRDPAAGENGGPPNVNHGYPQTVGPFPAWAILLVGDPFQQTYLGDDLDDEMLDEEDDADPLDTDLDRNSARQIGRLLKYQFDIEVWAQNSSDICLYYYHLLRYVIFSSLQTFEEAGMSQIEYAGRDVNPMTNFLPEDMWVRALRLEMIGEEKAWESVGRGTRIRGAYVEGGPEDDEDVVRNIVPYVPS